MAQQLHSKQKHWLSLSPTNFALSLYSRCRKHLSSHVSLTYYSCGYSIRFSRHQFRGLRRNNVIDLSLSLSHTHTHTHTHTRARTHTNICIQVLWQLYSLNSFRKLFLLPSSGESVAPTFIFITEINFYSRTPCKVQWIQQRIFLKNKYTIF